VLGGTPNRRIVLSTSSSAQTDAIGGAEPRSLRRSTTSSPITCRPSGTPVLVAASRLSLRYLWVELHLDERDHLLNFGEDAVLKTQLNGIGRL
jgi:hypothetical protein